MMTRALKSPTQQTPPPIWHEATVSLTLSPGCYVLDNGFTAQQAVSCLVCPQEGDKVLWLASKDGRRYITHLLLRPQSATANLAVPGASGIAISTSNLALTASEQLSIRSLGDAELSAPTGTLNMAARNLTITVLDSLLQLAKHIVGRCDNWLTEAKGLSRLHGQDTQVTADKDVRVDGERISMG
ncbi:DUF3540 domain-containing protein [Gallaecimonas pentaromativorans]|uniref:DUF3540 domain-containing protein n=1 Tax=Gallaecimonas pentaromativorans TaxID=584787 RepID=UPI00067F3E73|nr:DUF3540 domain-containing protein [Gallaecimonas pentaromativorans]MED5523367.1 DUF3540 domain-containing protein [Pseudomonadota bacterium]